jgi:SAM-dependent methyltransferase
MCTPDGTINVVKSPSSLQNHDFDVKEIDQTHMKLSSRESQIGYPDIKNEHAKDFLWLNIKDLPYFRSLLRAVEAQFYNEADLSAPTLDVGCGEGHFASLIFDRKIEVGLDPSQESLQEASERNVYQLLTEADGGRMPYPDGHFASAFSNSVLEHIPHVEQVLHETARVLKPGALFVFCVPNHRFNDSLSISRLLERLHLTGLAKEYRTFFTYIARHRHLDAPETWQARLEAAGFAVEKWWDYFSPEALAVLEWGHYWGLPSLLIRKLTGRWILIPSYWNLALTYRLLRPYSKAVACDDGVCTFYIARRAN